MNAENVDISFHRSFLKIILDTLHYLKRLVASRLGYDEIGNNQNRGGFLNMQQL